jgi:hypothetical protein
VCEIALVYRLFVKPSTLKVLHSHLLTQVRAFFRVFFAPDGYLLSNAHVVG